MTDQICPECGLVCPPSAQKCDCGRSFDARKPTEQRKPNYSFMIAFSFLGGIAGAILFGSGTALYGYMKLAAMVVIDVDPTPDIEFNSTAASVIGFLIGFTGGLIYNVARQKKP